MILQKDTIKIFKRNNRCLKINRGSGRMPHHHSTSRPRWEVHCVLQMPCFSATIFTSKWSSQHITLYEVGFHFRCYFRESVKMYQYKLFQLSIPKNDWHWCLSGLLPIHAAYTSKTKRRKTKKKEKKAEQCYCNIIYVGTYMTSKFGSEMQPK